MIYILFYKFIYNVGYDAPDHSEVDYIDIGWVGPAGQLFSSVDDLATLMKQYFAAYPSLFQQGVDTDYPFIVSPQTLREMVRPVYINPDQQTGFGSPWEMEMLKDHFIRGKGGNINGFSSEFDMIPEMKLGVIALANYDLDESMFTLPILEILIPAFKAWMNSMQYEEFVPVLPSNVDDYVGYYFDGELPLFEVYINNQTGNLMMKSSLNDFYGLLTWMGSEVNSGNSFIYNDLQDDVESCWTITLDAYDKFVMDFVTDESGEVIGVMLDGNDYGVAISLSFA